MFWESYLPLLCAKLGLSSPNASFFLTGEQTQSVTLPEVQNMHVVLRNSLALSAVRSKWKSWGWF